MVQIIRARNNVYERGLKNNSLPSFENLFEGENKEPDHAKRNL